MEITIDTIADGITTVRLVGRLDMAAAQEIDLHFSVVAGSRGKVIVDLEQISFLASMGIRTLLIGAKTIKAKGGRMALLNPTPDVEKVLLASGVDMIIPVVHDLASAIGTVSA